MSAMLQLLSREELNARLSANVHFLKVHTPWWSNIILFLIVLALAGAAAFPWWPEQFKALIPDHGEMSAEMSIGLALLAFVFVAGQAWTHHLNQHGNSLLMAITPDVLYVRLKLSYFAMPKASDKSFLAIPRHEIATINLFEGMKHQRSGSRSRYYYARLIDFHLKQPLPLALSSQLMLDFSSLADLLAKGQSPMLVAGPSGQHLRLNIPITQPSLKELFKLLQGMLFPITHRPIKQAENLN